MLRTCSTIALALATIAMVGCATPETGHDHGQSPSSSPSPSPSPSQGHGHGHGHGHGMMAGKMAVASLSPTQGNNARGLVMFHQMDGHVMVHAKVSGLKPGAEHGFHVHENGTCASADGMSAGGHFNPDGKPHGPQNAPHHAGDMPSLKADANGVADQKFMLMGVTVAAGATSVTGRSVIVHAMPDDYVTQPTGNSGARLGCGVIAGH
jgi:Cu-Zn family superoxide dismutase